MIVGLTLEKIGARDESNAFRISDTIAHDGQVPARLLTLIWNEKAKYNCMQVRRELKIQTLTIRIACSKSSARHARRCTVYYV